MELYSALGPFCSSSSLCIWGFDPIFLLLHAWRRSVCLWSGSEGSPETFQPPSLSVSSSVEWYQLFTLVFCSSWKWILFLYSG